MENEHRENSGLQMIVRNVNSEMLLILTRRVVN